MYGLQIDIVVCMHMVHCLPGQTCSCTICCAGCADQGLESQTKLRELCLEGMATPQSWGPKEHMHACHTRCCWEVLRPVNQGRRSEVSPGIMESLAS